MFCTLIQLYWNVQYIYEYVLISVVKCWRNSMHGIRIRDSVCFHWMKIAKIGSNFNRRIEKKLQILIGFSAWAFCLKRHDIHTYVRQPFFSFNKHVKWLDIVCRKALDRFSLEKFVEIQIRKNKRRLIAFVFHLPFRRHVV